MSEGYMHPGYAESLSGFGSPLELPQCRGWLLDRPIQETGLRDVMSCYPLFCCEKWEKLATDLNALSTTHVTATLVLDPFLPLSVVELKEQFDSVISFKEHYIVDVQNFNDNTPDRHHRYYARKALDTMTVRLVDQPHDFLEDWIRLYARLTERHKLGGIKAFSRDCFSRQLSLPGLRMYIAECAGRVIASQLWFTQGEVAYSHLTAISQEGYESRASYGLYWSAIQSLCSDPNIRWLDLGAGAGSTINDNNGLAKFKKGWSNSTRTKFLCTRIFNHEAYDRLLRLTGSDDINYFPAYRQSEIS